MKAISEQAVRVFSSSETIPPEHKGAVIALGNFDGLHRGHQAVINQARKIADEKGESLALALFTPHPTRFFKPDYEPFLLMSDYVREDILPQFSVSRVYKIPFNDRLREMDDIAFVDEVLHKSLGVSHIVVGADFGFGKNRCGTAESLSRLAGERGIGVSAVDPIGLHKFYGKYGSTEIRGALKKGNVMHAAHMLTRPWTIDGVVIKGEQRGRTINFPTANLEFGSFIQPLFGVYTVEIRLEGETLWRPGVANVGTRPTVGGEAARLEVHLFDFNKDIYGQHVLVRFRSFIRPEEKFESFQALKTQIEQDARGARAVFGLKCT